MREISIRFEVELLEDLHTGTGVGRLGIVDDTQSRDRQGHPVVWASTFRGLLREAGEDWLWVRQQAGATPAEVDGDRARLYRLLGRTVEESAASAAGIAQVRSLRLVETAISTARPYFLIWASTAREVRSRRPEEQTLRQVEHARAGLIFKGELRFPADDQFQAATHPDTIFLVRLLKRLPSLGGGKTRGWGQIRLCAEPHPEHLPLPSAPTASTACVRLLLENLEPLNLAATALAGNLIRAQSYIPGTRLRAALLHWFSGHGALTLADRLAVPAAMQVGNAYFVSVHGHISPMRQAESRTWAWQKQQRASVPDATGCKRNWRSNAFNWS
ncbi:MAG TPA: RAMP superfamily CRISPR-associated protein, partial [Gemmataceae bacterium]|nr:RAMP superfamily CRISPR-associated protein [Gemmataceae bacterium]